MSDPRGKQWDLTLASGVKITIGASIDEDRGVWILSTTGLTRWMTTEDVRNVTQALRDAARHLDEGCTCI